MDIPKLSDTDRKTWQSLQSLSDEDLYALLGGEPTGFYQPISAPESLLVTVEFRKTAETIKRAIKKLGRIKEVIREEICKAWKSLKESTIFLDKMMVFALLLEIIRQSIDDSYHFPCEAAAELICRACEYNLDKFCEVLEKQ
jgi:hypothetical protein